jgi:hypothetical protein
VNLSALFLSAKRLNEIVVVPERSRLDDSIGSVEGVGRLRPIAEYEGAVVRWMERESPPTLGELITRDALESGSCFTHLGPFFGRGIGDASCRFADGKHLKRVPVLWAKLDSWKAGLTIHVQAHPANFTSVSAAAELSGKKRLFLLGRLTEVSTSRLLAQAYAIGHIHQYDGRSFPAAEEDDRLRWHMEVFPSMIDTFALDGTEAPPTKDELLQLLRTPEASIKQAFAEVIGEPFVPKDWGGERSDLVSSQVRWRNKQYVTAFLFKGPAKPKPMTVADLGKNGDQISRLFMEPADLLLPQHCSSVTPAVRDHMRAFATRVARLRHFVIIDGADTIRILRRHSKLGFGARASSAHS